MCSRRFRPSCILHRPAVGPEGRHRTKRRSRDPADARRHVHAIETNDLERYATYIHEDFTSFGETDTYLNEDKAFELRSVQGWTERSADIRTEMHQPEVTVRGETAWITY